MQKAVPKRRRTAVSEAIRKEEEDLAIAITQSLQSIEAPTETSSTGVTMVSERSTLEEEDDDKVIVVQSNMCLTENWVCIFVDFVWQEQKVSLFGKGAPPIRGKHGPKEPVKCTRTQRPARVRRIEGDGNCLFRAISYCIWRDESHYSLVRAQIVEHFPDVWAHRRIQYSAKAWYLKKTKQEEYVNLRDYHLTVNEYVEASEMTKNRVYGGSTEIETAAHLLKTPIRVYYEGNPVVPACSWVVYGEEYVSNTAKSIVLNWRFGNHFEVVNKM